MRRVSKSPAARNRTGEPVAPIVAATLSPHRLAVPLATGAPVASITAPASTRKHLASSGGSPLASPTKLADIARNDLALRPRFANSSIESPIRPCPPVPQQEFAEWNPLPLASAEDSQALRSCCDEIAKTYREALQSLKIGRDELSVHNKYHFCVRWHRLDACTMGPEDAQCIRIVCAAYIKGVMRSVAADTLFSCSPNMLQWTSSELALAARFMERHEIGKSRESMKHGGSAGGLGDLRTRLVFTVAYWLQKLSDHGLLNYPDYKVFAQWAIAACDNWLGTNTSQRFGALRPHLKRMLLACPVRVINTTYTVQRLGADPGDSWILELWHSYQTAWTPLLSQQPFRWKDYLYGLTHFVLNESNFYQEPVDLRTRCEAWQEEIAWMLDYFNANMPRILELADPDILGEVALCYLLCQRADRRDIESCAKCMAFIASCLQIDEASSAPDGSSPRRYIHRNGPGGEPRGIKIEEHTNAVCLLALGFWSRWTSARHMRVFGSMGPLFSHAEWAELCQEY